MKIVLSTLKFVAGFSANLVCQLFRATFNLASCLAFAVGCLASLALAALQSMGGGREAGFESLLRSLNFAKISAKAGLLSTVQAACVALLLSPMLRGAQACTESIRPRGLFVPSGAGRNLWQSAIGLNSWSPKDVTSPPPEKPSLPQTAPDVVPIQSANSRPAKSNKPKGDDEWDLIAAEYIKADSMKKMDAMRIKMATRYPSRYAQVLEQARKIKANKKLVGQQNEQA